MATGSSNSTNELKVSIEYKYTPPQSFIAKLNDFLKKNKPPNFTIQLKWKESAEQPRPRPSLPSSTGSLKGYKSGSTVPVISSLDNTETCPECLCVPCVVKLPPDFLVGSGPAHIHNQEKRYQLYRKFWRLLGSMGLWKDERYIRRKERRTVEDDKREIIPACIDIRSRYPNPEDVPYVDYLSTFDAQL